MSKTVTITSANGICPEYQTGETIRIIDTNHWPWWRFERPFFPVPEEVESMTVENTSVDGTEVTITMSEPRKEWVMKSIMRGGW